MENNEKNPIEEKEQNLSELGNEQMEQAAGGGVNLGAILDIASEGIKTFLKDGCQHELGALLSTSYRYTGKGYVPYVRTRIFRCRKCDQEIVKEDEVADATL